MNRLTTLLITTALIFQGAIALAQIDEAKMERDLRVASSVLASLTKKDDMMFSRNIPEGNYVEGFGVIFTIEDQTVFRYNYKMMNETAKAAQKEAQRAVKEAQRAQREAERGSRGQVSSGGSNEPVFVPAPSIPIDGSFAISGSQKEIDELMIKSENASKEFTKKLKEAFEIFLADYSQLVSQLKPTDKFLLTTKNGSSMHFVFVRNKYGNLENKKNSSLSAEMLVKDHKDFTAGKISREKLLAKIKFIENAEVEAKPDLDLFSNMLKTTYNSKYTETYFMSSMPRYEILTGLGVVYSVKVFSSYEQGAFYRMPTLNQTGMSEEERNKAVEEMYPQFVDGFKESIIRYGSTIKSLKESDKLIIKVEMTKCETCTFPPTIEFVVDKSVLDQFSKGSLTLAQAKGKVKLK
ncbi:MAG: hypothetical protein L3J06_07600 [Cyclobacteriaceae bacterium]|nr:hypothetical protein [Cyclobacteriaceae bacterium]